jgi:hypothetical protein
MLIKEYGKDASITSISYSMPIMSITSTANSQTSNRLAKSNWYIFQCLQEIAHPAILNWSIAWIYQRDLAHTQNQTLNQLQISRLHSSADLYTTPNQLHNDCGAVKSSSGL